MECILKQKNIKPVIAWDNGKDIFFVYRKNGKKEIEIVSDFDWYFVVNREDFDKPEVQRILKQSAVFSGNAKADGDFVKLYCRKQNSYRELEALTTSLKKVKVKPLEADLNLTKRYMVDNMVEIEEDMSVLFFDIETDDSNQGIVIGRDRILSFAGCDLDGKTVFEKDKNEKTLLLKMLKVFSEYDMIVGWNSSQFDIPYIQERAKRHAIKIKKDGKIVALDESDYWKKIIHVDLMKRLIKLFGPMMTTVGLSGFSLNEVSKVFLGEQKVKFEGRIIDLYNNDPDTFEKYNIMDVKLLHKLNQKLQTIPLMIKECAWTGTFMDRFYIGELLDNYILREASKQNFYLKSRPSWGESKDSDHIKIKGAFVMEPKVGLYDNIRVFDFKSMYPSIIVGWNIGQESLIKGRISEIAKKDFEIWLGDRKIEDVPYKEWHEFLKEENEKLNPKNEFYQTANNQFFRKDFTSIISGLVKRLLDERKAYKKQQLESEYNSIEYKNSQASQEAVKEMSNSMYGITADKQARYFDKRISEAITMTGQFLNRTAIVFCEKMGYNVIYADTDSLFTKIDDDKETAEAILNLNKKLSTYLNRKYGFKQNIILVEYEKKFRKFIMLDKKRYSGHLIEIDDKPVNSVLSKGTENVRKSSIVYTRTAVEKLLNLLLRKDKDSVYCRKWIQKLKKQILEDEIPADKLSITMKLSKPISSYKSKPPHVRLAEKMIEENKILETHEGKHVWGQKIEYIITDSKNKNESILLEEFNGTWDRKYYWDVQVYAPLMRILKVAWPDETWEQETILLFEKIKMKEERELKKKQKEEEKKTKIIKKENNKKTKKNEQLKMF